MDTLKKNKKQFPQYLHFRCGMTHLTYSLKNLGKIFKLQKELLKTEMNHDEIDGKNYKDKINEWLPYVKTTSYVLLLLTLDFLNLWKRLRDFR